MPAPNASSQPRPEPTHRWTPCQLQKLRLSNRWKTESLFPRSTSPKGWGCQLEDKHYFSYQIPATWMTNNVVHSNLPQSASENFSAEFHFKSKSIPRESKQICEQRNANTQSGFLPRPAATRPPQALEGHSLSAPLAAGRCFLALDPDG